MLRPRYNRCLFNFWLWFDAMTELVVDYMQRLGESAREASRVLARASTAQKNQALLATADALDKSRAALLEANDLDMQAGRTSGDRKSVV